jgi:hypothetical protein
VVVRIEHGEIESSGHRDLQAVVTALFSVILLISASRLRSGKRLHRTATSPAWTALHYGLTGSDGNTVFLALEEACFPLDR